MNIRFIYLYRDAGNFKNWGEVIFENKNNYDAGHLEKQIRTILIDQEFFVADKLDIPILRFQEHIDRLDHDWHEFHSFEPTFFEQTDTLSRDVSNFIESLRCEIVL